MAKQSLERQGRHAKKKDYKHSKIHRLWEALLYLYGEGKGNVRRKQLGRQTSGRGEFQAEKRLLQQILQIIAVEF